MDRVRFGIVGCGAIATLHHIPNLKKAPRAEVVAVADIDEERAKEVAGSFGIPRYFTSYRDMIDRTDIDALTVCTPTKYHAPAAVYALENNLHVFCEKPMCLTLEEADQIAQSLEKTSSKFMVGYNLRFTNLFQKVKSMISDGEQGDLIQVECSFCVPGPKKWPAITDFYQKRELGGGALFDSGSHAIDLLRWITGEVEGVSASVFRENDETSIDEAASLLLRFHGDTIGVVNASWTSPWPVVKTEIYGSEGLLFASFPENILSKEGIIAIHKYRGITFKEGIIKMGVKENATMYQKELHHFLDCIRRGEDPSVSVSDGRAAVAVTLAAYESAEEKREVSIR